MSIHFPEDLKSSDRSSKSFKTALTSQRKDSHPVWLLEFDAGCVHLAVSSASCRNLNRLGSLTPFSSETAAEQILSSV